MPTRILLTLFVAVFFASCSSPGKITNDTDSQRLIFGSGGGFTGMYTSYGLYEDGRLFSLLADSTQKQLKKLRKKQTRDIFALANNLKLAIPAFNHPGNMSSFINFRVYGVSTEYKWGDPNVSVPGEIKDFYSQLNAIVK
jgi:amino acid permease